MLCLRRLSVILTITCLLATNTDALFGQDTKETLQEEAARLIAVLKSDASVFDKAKACQRLAVVGEKEAVPALAALLADEQLSNYARYGLEAIPDPAADDALREAMGQFEGNRLIGVISSIGRRRDAKAVDGLAKWLTDDDPAVAAAAAKALGYIGNAQAAGILQKALTKASPEQRPATASACLLCAEGLLKQEQRDQAFGLYDTVREADVPKHVVMAATLHAIIARGDEGISLLVEELKSDDESRFRNAIHAARSLGGDVSGVLIAHFDKQPAARQVVILLALGDIGDETALPTIQKAIKTGTGEVRAQGIRLLATFGDASVVPMLFDAAADSDEAIAQAARVTLAAVQSEGVDSAIVKMLDTGDARALQLAIELAGQRCISSAAPSLLKLADNSEANVRLPAINALGTTIGLDDLPRLLARMTAEKAPDEALAVKKAIQVACARMPDREACADQLSQAMSGAPTDVRVFLLEQLAAVGGDKSLSTVVAAARSQEELIQDAATRVLGEWPNADAAPELFELAKTLENKKYKIRALRGYIRIARQLSASPEQSVEICRNALVIADRDDERKLAIDVLARVATADALAVAVSCLSDDRPKGRAAGAVIAIGEKLIQASPGEVGRAVKEALPVVSNNPSLADRAKMLLAQAERSSAAERDEEGFVSIFDGKTMKGWEGNMDMFRIEDGAIIAGTMKARIPRNEFLCTEKEYEDFELRLQFKILGERPNAGIQIRSQRIPNHHEVCGYQADLGVGWWGCLYDESRRRKVLAGPEPKKRAEPVRMNDWNDYRIRCEGRCIQLWINGVQTVDYTEQDANIERKGIIGLQVHSGAPMEAWYRNIRIKELQP